MATAAIGHNNPPEDSPYEAIKRHIDDLFDTAKGFLDGDPVNDEATAAMVSKLINDAREARAEAEKLRKAEAKPFDDGKAAVQAKWTPLTDEKKGRCALIADTAKKALQPWLEKLDREREEAAKKAREEAEAAAQAAQEALRASQDLEERERAEELLTAAAKAEKAANKAENASATVKGGTGRAIGLVSVWEAVMMDRKAALFHYLQVAPQEFESLIQRMADGDVRAGIRAIPGFIVKETKVAR